MLAFGPLTPISLDKWPWLRFRDLGITVKATATYRGIWCEGILAAYVATARYPVKA